MACFGITLHLWHCGTTAHSRASGPVQISKLVWTGAFVVAKIRVSFYDESTSMQLGLWVRQPVSSWSGSRCGVSSTGRGGDIRRPCSMVLHVFGCTTACDEVWVSTVTCRFKAMLKTGLGVSSKDRVCISNTEISKYLYLKFCMRNSFRSVTGVTGRPPTAACWAQDEAGLKPNLLMGASEDLQDKLPWAAASLLGPRLGGDIYPQHFTQLLLCAQAFKAMKVSCISCSWIGYSPIKSEHVTTLSAIQK